MIARLEALRLWRSRRLHATFLALVFFLGLMLVGFYTYAQTETGGRAEFRYTYENRSYFNGLTFALYAFYFGYLLILPIFAVTEAGAQLAGDRPGGQLSLLLGRPITRTRLFGVKVALASATSLVSVAALLLLGLGLGLAAVGWGDLDLYPGVLQMTDRHQHLAQATALQRFLFAWPAAALGLAAPFGLGLLVSSASERPVQAVGLSIALYLVLYVVAEVHFFVELRPWLFTSYMAYWRELFREEIRWERVVSDGARLLGFAVLFLVLALHRFRTREER